jgi:hypothetical protein
MVSRRSFGRLAGAGAVAASLTGVSSTASAQSKAAGTPASEPTAAKRGQPSFGALRQTKAAFSTSVTPRPAPRTGPR